MYTAAVKESKFHASLGLPLCRGPPRSARPGPLSARPQASKRPCSVLLSLPAPTPPPTKLAEPRRPLSTARQSPVRPGSSASGRPSSAGPTCRRAGSPREVKPAKRAVELADGEPIQEGEQEEAEEPDSGEAAAARAAASYREAKIKLRICRLLGQEPTEAEKAAARACLAPLSQPSAEVPHAAGAGDGSPIRAPPDAKGEGKGDRSKHGPHTRLAEDRQRVVILDALALEHNQVFERKLESRKLAKRLDRWDRRWHNLGAKAKGLEHERRMGSGPQGSKLSGAAVPQWLASATGQSGEDHEAHFLVAQVSSEHPDHPASNLMVQEGAERWQTREGQTEKQHICIVLLDQPNTVSSVEISYPDADRNSTPRRVWVQYSAEGVDGPWLNAFRFTVENPGSRSAFSKHQHHYGRYSRQFSSIVLKHCNDLASAYSFLNVSKTGFLNRQELVGVCNHLKALKGSALCSTIAAAASKIDVLQLFQEQDGDNLGSVSVEKLLCSEFKVPVTKWWRILFMDNFGHPSFMSLGCPLKICCLEKGARAHEPLQLLKQSRVETRQAESAEGGEEVHEKAAETKLLKRIARENGVPFQQVERIYEEFRVSDPDGSGSIDRKEFEVMMTRLSGMERHELPLSRLHTFFVSMDYDKSGSIDFLEFLTWYKIMLSETEDSARRKPGMQSSSQFGAFGQALVQAVRKSANAVVGPKVATAEGAMGSARTQSQPSQEQRQRTQSAKEEDLQQG